MKKYLLSFAVLLMGTSVLTSCLDDDDDNNGNYRWPVAVNNGIYVVNAGNQEDNITGSLTYVDTLWNATTDAFRNATNRNLGVTANDGVVYGSKLYIVVSEENTIEVLNNKSLSPVRTINTVSKIGSDKGNKPRCIVAAGGFIFVSTYDGYVAAIDTANFNLYKTYKVGSYPEGMALSPDGSVLYVANSDYGRGNGSLSAIDLYTEEVQKFTDKDIVNPTQVAVNSYGLFVLDYGSYDENWNQIGAGVRKVYNGKVSVVVPDATSMAMSGRNIFTINAPYGSSAVTSYKVYDTMNGTVSDFIANGDHTANPEAPYSPAAIAVDVVRNMVYISSYSRDPDTGSAGYSIDGYLNAYDVNGKTRENRADRRWPDEDNPEHHHRV